MYSHFLVPVDGTLFSAINVRSAVDLARKLGARITFFHAMADYAATQDGALIFTIDPALFQEAAVGEAHVVLMQAVASAKAAGISCQAASCTSDRPAQAIADAAALYGADLIVMASRGLRGIAGWLHSSQTERVLRRAPVALLVTRVETRQPLDPGEHALSIIQDEHRSIAVVTDSLRTLSAPDLALDDTSLRQVELLMRHMQDFPEQLHHPKEESYLHRHLRRRHPACESLLSAIEAKHQEEADCVAAVFRALAQCQLCRCEAEQARLKQTIRSLVTLQGRHMAMEESTLHPLARAHLTAADWADVLAAFEAHDDPRFGDLPSAEFDRLFKRIASLASQGLPAAERGLPDR